MKSKILLTVFLLLSVPFVALADDSLTENLIPFTAIVTPFVALLLALFFFWLYSYRKEQIWLGLSRRLWKMVGICLMIFGRLRKRQNPLRRKLLIWA